MADQPVAWCPRCLQTTGDAELCPVCRLPQKGAEADRLRQIAFRLNQISVEQSTLAAEGPAPAE